MKTSTWETTDFFQDVKAAHGGESGAWAELARSAPMGRFASAEEIAAGILY